MTEAAAVEVPLPSPLDPWTDAVLQAGEEMAETLGLGTWGDVTRGAEIPKGLRGGMVAVVGRQDGCQVGVLVDGSGAEVLTRTMLMMEPEEEVDDELISDTLCEMANIVAGGVKSRVNGAETSYALGLPVYFAGEIHLPRGAQKALLHVDIGHVPVLFLLGESQFSRTS